MGQLRKTGPRLFNKQPQFLDSVSVEGIAVVGITHSRHVEVPIMFKATLCPPRGYTSWEYE